MMWNSSINTARILRPRCSSRRPVPSIIDSGLVNMNTADLASWRVAAVRWVADTYGRSPLTLFIASLISATSGTMIRNWAILYNNKMMMRLEYTHINILFFCSKESSYKYDSRDESYLEMWSCVPNRVFKCCSHHHNRQFLESTKEAVDQI